MKRRWVQFSQDRSVATDDRRDRSTRSVRRRFAQMDEDDAQENVRRQRNRVLKAFAVATVCHVLIFSGASQLKKVPSSSGKAVASGPLSVVFLDREDARAQKERAPQEPKKKEAKKDQCPKDKWLLYRPIATLSPQNKRITSVRPIIAWSMNPVLGLPAPSPI